MLKNNFVAYDKSNLILQTQGGSASRQTLTDISIAENGFIGKDVEREHEC